MRQLFRDIILQSSETMISNTTIYGYLWPSCFLILQTGK